MLQLRHKYSTKTRSDCKAKIIIKNEDSDDDDDKLDAGLSEQKITRERNHIYFHSEIDRNAIFELIGHIRKAELDNIVMAHQHCTDPIPIYIHISSYGGSVFDALTAIDVIQACKVPVYTIIEGATASAGTLMSVVGAKRFIRPNAYMLIHQLSSGFWGKMAEIEDDFENNKALMEKIKAIYIKHATIPKKELSEVLKHDLWWDAEKSLKYGLVDKLWEHA
jgi:ATP-dependent Clp endopeptidase proteolytic subunit ClpP